MSWIIVATWNTSFKAVSEGSKVLIENGNSIDAIEVAARIVEDDPDITNVGFGGFPNIDGDVELDAAIMDGNTMKIGAVAGIKKFANPISLAKCVMQKSCHNFLVGLGAEKFALENGFKPTNLLTENMGKLWREKIVEFTRGNLQSLGHDTVGLVAMDEQGNIAAGTSTSGMAMKHSGRVGDSPLVGSGFYADNAVGAAAATGTGEDIMKGCVCFLAVELMRSGMKPDDAAKEAVRRTHERLLKFKDNVGEIALICINKKGEAGAAANHEGFSYVIASDIINQITIENLRV